MKLLSDWIILNLGATLAFSALWVAVVVVVAAFMGVRAGFVRVVGWVSGLFARKRDQAIKALSDVVTPVAIGGQASQPQWIADVLAERDAVRRFNERAQIGRYLADSERCIPSEAARMTDWRGTGGAREDRETIIEATWQGNGRGFTGWLALALIASLALSACSSTPAQQATLATAGLTLAAIAAQNNTTVASVVTKGALFCQLGGGAGVVAVVNAAGAPVSVTGQTSAAVAAACMAFQAVPVPPPADPSSVPTQTAATTLPAVQS